MSARRFPPPGFPLDAARRLAFEDALRAAVGTGTGPLDRASRYALGWETEDGSPHQAGGKRFRPSLCLFTCEALGGTFEAALPAAVSLELVHNFSLVHDDIQDRDEIRHARRTLWAIHGEAQAINAGDYLYALGLRALASAPGDPGLRIAQLDALVDAIAAMVGGQWQDVSFERAPVVTADQYLEMTAGKTGAMYAASTRLGAIAAGASSTIRDGVAAWGMKAGLAFQAQDDYLGVWGSEAATGKGVGADLLRRKKSLPVVLGLADPGAAPVIREEYARPAGEAVDVRTMVDALAGAGVDAACRAIARRLADEAGRALEEAGLDADTRSVFGAVADAFVDRDR